MERREQKQTTTTHTIEHPSPPFPGPTPPTITTTHLASHHQQPSFRCLTTHTRSWGWVVKHRPHPAILRWLARTPCIQTKRGCGTGAQARENPTPATPANTTASRQPARTQLPCADPTATDPGLSAVTYGKARGGRGDRPERASFGCSSESCLPKKRCPSHPHAETYLCSAPRTKPTPPDPPFFSRLKIVLGSLGIDPGAGALPGFDGEDGRLIGRSAIAMRLAQRRRQDQQSPERVHQAPRPRTKTSA
jgi:hypothetical protein